MKEPQTVPPDWEKAGCRFGRDQLLYLPERRRGFTVHELREMFWRCQQQAHYRRERDQAHRDLEAAHAEIDALEHRTPGIVVRSAWKRVWTWRSAGWRLSSGSDTARSAASCPAPGTLGDVPS